MFLSYLNLNKINGETKLDVIHSLIKQIIPVFLCVLSLCVSYHLCNQSKALGLRLVEHSCCSGAEIDL